MNLKEKGCEPCRVGAPKASSEEIQDYLKALPNWEVDESSAVKKIKKTYAFTRYAESLDFVNRVGECSEDQGHHPVMLFEFRQVTVEWWTHKIEGLHVNDFVMASKCDGLYADMVIDLQS